MNVDLRPRRPVTCLSDYLLDQLVSGDLAGRPEEGAAREHLAACARCSDRLAAFAAVEAPVLAATDALPAGTARPRRPERRAGRLMAALAVVGAAAVGAVLVFGGGRDETGTRTKGLVTLGVVLRRPSGEIVRLGQGEAVAPRDSLRFEVASARSGFVAVLGLDAAGRASAYIPASGPMVRLERGSPVVLPGSIVADDTLGPERIVAVVCNEPRPVADLRALAGTALARAAGDPGRVPDLGTACAETMFDIQKRTTP